MFMLKYNLHNYSYDFIVFPQLIIISNTLEKYITSKNKLYMKYLYIKVSVII